MFFGYPLIATPEGKFFLDATLGSPQKGIVLFDLIEGTDVGDYASRQDDLANKIEAKLKLHKDLVKGRRLIPSLQVITFAPAVDDVERVAVEGYPIAGHRESGGITTGAYRCARQFSTLPARACGCDSRGLLT